MMRFLAFLLVGLAIVTSIVFQQPLRSQDVSLPSLKVHPLPSTLQQWQDSQNQDDYFSDLESSPVGALIWSEFPIKIYFDQPNNPNDLSASNQQFQQWVKVVGQALSEWNVYLPLTQVSQKKLADITIERAFPSSGSSFNSETRKLEIPRARAAQTRYDFYITDTDPPLLSHRMTIQISPNLSQSSVLSAIRHEFGHALGIWGHSPIETDALYFSQVQQTPPISARDINTLKKVYQQPTRLGWIIESEK